MTPHRQFAPYDDTTQPAMVIPGYRETSVRVPRMPLFKRPLTLTDITGPTRIAQKLKPGANPGDGNLAHPYPDKPRALGQLIRVGGRLLDEDGMPVKQSVIEIWHCNASGRYIH